MGHGRKRTSTAISEDAPPSKQIRKDESVIVVESEDEDNMERIMARIREQEERETRGRASGGTSSTTPGGGSSSRNAIVFDLTDDEYNEEAALQWAMQESMKNAHSASTSQQPRFTTASLADNKGKAKASLSPFTYSNAGSDIPPDEQLATHRDVFIRSSPCSKCGTLLPSPRGFVAFSVSDPPPTLAVLLHLCCKRCKLSHCRGCLAPLACSISCKGPGSARYTSCKVLTCCAAVRAIALFEVLGSFDRLYKNEQESSDQRARVAAAKKLSTATSASVGPGGTGYSADAAKNPYGGSPRGGGRPAGVKTRMAVQQAEVQWDQTIVRILHTITSLLPASYADEPAAYDLLPHTSIGALLSLSLIPTVLAGLLRNDSVTDWIARDSIYEEMLKLLRRLAECELTVGLLVERPFERSSWAGLQAWMWDDEEARPTLQWTAAQEQQPVSPPKDTRITKARGKRTQVQTELGGIALPRLFERGTPLYAHFKKLTVQCQTFLAGAEGLIDGSGSAEEEVAMKALSLCGDVIAARDDLERAVDVLGKSSTVPGILDSAASNGDSMPVTTTNKGKERDTAGDIERLYAEACERLSFKYATLSADGPGGLSYSSFAFGAQVSQSASATRNPKDRLHLIKELSTIATSLPSGVWVRIDEVRNDVIKIMIAGPVGTPYEGGLFEFDCYMPLNYPHSPPQMHLRTTGGGTVRFNPNLYNTGKVCLSLLGTWAGRPEEQWLPGKSTLLQVLISIQSMILIELPYFNEPGYGKANPDNRSSQEYNENIRLQTVKWAIVDWLKDEHRHGIWADIIATHFSIREESIRTTIEKWSRSNPNIRNYSQSSRYQSQFGGAQMTGPYYISQTHSKPIGLANANVSVGLDLVQAFERGIECIKKWPVDGAVAGY